MAFGNVGRLSVILTAKTKKLVKGLKTSEESLRKVQQTMRGVAATSAKMTAALGIAGVGAAVFAGRFEKQMVRASAIAAGTASKFDDSFARMSASALGLAGRTEFTAQQVGEGMEKMAMAGNNATKIIGAMPAVLQLASAASLDLGQSADIVTNIMAGFGKQTSELKDANNVLVGTFTGANVSLQELGEAFKIVGPVSKALRVDFEDTAAAIGLLGNAGIKGSDAGTGLKRAFTALANTTPKSKKAFDALGVSVEDLVDPNKGIGTIIAKLQGTQAAFNKAGKDAAFTGLIFKAFGERAGPKMAALIGQGADAFDKLTNKIDDAKATDLASFLETKQVESFTGQLNILRSAFEQMVIAIGQKVIPMLEPMVKHLQEVFKNIASLSDETIASIATWGKWAFGIAAAVTAAATIAAGILGATAAVVGFTFAAEASGVALSLLAAGPLVAAVAGVAAFLGALELVEEVTGKNINLFDEFKSAMEFATQSAGTFKSTLVDLVAALVKTAEQVLWLSTLGLIDLDLSSKLGISDAVNDAENLSKSAKKIIAAKAEIEDIRAHAKKRGFTEAESVGEFKHGIPITGGFSGVDKMSDRFGNTRAGKKSAEELSQQLEAAQRKLSNALVEERIRRQANLNEQNKAAEKEEENAKQKKKREDEAKAAEEKAAKVAAKAAANDKKRLKLIRDRARAMERIADLQQRAERARMTGEVGAVGSPILGAMFQFEDSSAELQEAAAEAEALGRSFEGLSEAIDSRRSAMLDSIAASVAGKEGTDDFAEAMRMAEDVLGSMGIEIDEVTKRLKNLGVDGDEGDADDKRKRARRIADLYGKQIEESMPAFGTGMEDVARRFGLAFGEEGMKAIKDGKFADALTQGLGAAFLEIAKQGKIKATGKQNVGLTPEEIATAGGRADEAAAGLSSLTGGGGAGAAAGGAIGGLIGMLGGPIGAGAGAVVGGILDAVGGAITGAITGAFDFVAGVIMGAGNVLAGAIEGAAGAVAGVIPEERLSGAVSEVGGAVAAAIGAVVAVVAGIVTATGAAIVTLGPPLLSLAMLIGAVAVTFGVVLAPLVALGIVIGALLLPVIIVLVVQLAILVAVVTAVLAAFAILFALGAVFAVLFRETEAFADLMGGFEASVDRLIERLEPLGAMLVPLLGLFDVFVDVLIAFADAFVGVTGLGPLLFEAFKAVLVGLAALLYAAAFVGNAFLMLVAVVADAGAWLVNGFAEILNGLAVGLSGFIAAIMPLLVGIGLAEAAQATINGLVAVAGASTDGANTLRGIGEGARGMMVDLDAVGAAIVGLIETDISAARQRGQNLIDQKKAQDEANESLLNVPQGYKVALARFRAIQTGADVGGRPVNDGVGFTGNGNANASPITIEEVYVSTNDPRQLYLEMQEEADRARQRRGGNSFGDNEFNRGGN